MIKKLELLFDCRVDVIELTPSEGYRIKADKIEKIVGISGGADQPGSEYVVKRIIDDFLRRFTPHNSSVAIVTGGTQYNKDGIPIFGIPAYSTTRAHELGFFTIGIFPERGEKYTHGLGDDLDMRVKVSSRYGESGWGDEFEIYTKLIDAALIIGGGEGTLAEFSHVTKTNRTRLDHKQDPIFVVPLIGIGGISELIPYVASGFKQSDTYLPEKRITKGEDAAIYLMNKMGM